MKFAFPRCNVNKMYILTKSQLPIMRISGECLVDCDVILEGAIISTSTGRHNSTMLHGNSGFKKVVESRIKGVLRQYPNDSDESQSPLLEAHFEVLICESTITFGCRNSFSSTFFGFNFNVSRTLFSLSASSTSYTDGRSPALKFSLEVIHCFL
ncbi:hypothetical protein EYC80_004394 [Monilinia laxa]|uniref:Uncharacterized protein n=1 Tax=Monilinia laxa TaxID=61186 RepID=A0A5N6KN92_MONLA|nr:hypothetical protein EYC80_004394 [Monilinia laxa]